MSVKNSISSFLLLAALGVLPAVGALAQTEAGTSPSATVKPSVRPGVMKEERQMMKDNREAMQDQRKELRARLDEKRKMQISNHFGRMVKRLEAALDRQSKLGERIQSRIDKAKANGKNVTKAQTALDKAKVMWQDAKKALDDAKAKFETLLASDDPKTVFKEVQTLIGTARDKIKGVHAAFVDAVKALKGVGEGGNNSASGTTGVSPAVSPSTPPTP